MKRKEFKIGNTFWINDKQFLCTDIGKRVIIGIEIKYTVLNGETIVDTSWLAGPPYALAELVFDEHSLPVCKHDKPKDD